MTRAPSVRARVLLVAVLVAGGSTVVLGLAGPIGLAGASTMPPLDPTTTPAAGAEASATPTLPPASVTSADPADDPAGPLADPEGAADASPPLTTAPTAAARPTATSDPTPTATSASAPDAGPSPSPSGDRGGPSAANPPGQVDDARLAEILAAIQSQVDGDDDGPRVDHLLHRMLGMAPGPSTSEGYDLGASVAFGEQVWTFLARYTYTFGKVAVAASAWLLDLVLQFDLGRLLAGPSGATAGRYAALLDDGALPLRHLALLVAVAHAGWAILRHRSHAAVPELLLAAAIAVAGAYLLDNADRSACVGLSVMGELTTGVMDLATVDPDPDEPPPDPAAWCDVDEVPAGSAQAAVARREAVDAVVTQTFVVDPFMLLQWGVVPAPETPCREVADALVAARPWGDDDFPRAQMAAAGCTDMVAFNRDMGAARMLGVHVYALSAAAFGVAVALSAGTLLVAQVAGALLVLVLPFAVVVGIAPGAGRQALARWLHALLKVAVLFIGSGFFLAAMVAAIDAVQTGTEDVGVVVRMLLSTAVAWSMVLLRGRVMTGARELAQGIARQASGGQDVGPVGRGVAQVGIATAHRAADVVYTAHAGGLAARAVAGGVASAATAGSSVVGQVAAGAGRTGVAAGRQSLLAVGALRAARRRGRGAGGTP